MSSSDSDSDSDYVGSDAESYTSLCEELEEMSHLIADMYAEAEELEEIMGSLQRPIESLEIAQLGTIPFLQTSPFRTATFAIKPPGIPGVDLTRRYTFAEICAALRNYVFATGSVDTDGHVTLNEAMKTLFETQKSRVSYIELMGMLRTVLV
jgi:hypothetical protein